MNTDRPLGMRLFLLLALAVAPLAAQTTQPPNGTYTATTYANAAAGLSTAPLPRTVPVSARTGTGQTMLLRSVTVVVSDGAPGAPKAFVATYKLTLQGETSERTATIPGAVSPSAMVVQGTVNTEMGGDVWMLTVSGSPVVLQLMKQRGTGFWYLIESSARMKLSYGP